ncbi:MAG: DUF3027 domain-containing protein [Rhodoluna sp.]|nr:DUF3027 domain-containing protein [Rhodoluna sp.]
MPKTNDNKTFAYNAAVEAASRNAVGFFIDSVEEDEGVVTYLFEGKLKGYSGWRWSVSVFQGEGDVAPTISEVLLVPGPDSLVAPDWVPWSERLADYKALQAELEAQAALEAEEAEDAEDSEEAEDGDEAEEAADEPEELEDADSNEHVEAAEEVEPAEDELAAANVEESVEAEADTGKTRKRPRFLRRRNRGAGKKKNDES